MYQPKHTPGRRPTEAAPSPSRATFWRSVQQVLTAGRISRAAFYSGTSPPPVRRKECSPPAPLYLIPPGIPSRFLPAVIALWLLGSGTRALLTVFTLPTSPSAVPALTCRRRCSPLREPLPTQRAAPAGPRAGPSGRTMEKAGTCAIGGSTSITRTFPCLHKSNRQVRSPCGKKSDASRARRHARPDTTRHGPSGRTTTRVATCAPGM